MNLETVSKGLRKETGGIGNQSKNHLDHSIIKIDLNTRLVLETWGKLFSVILLWKITSLRHCDRLAKSDIRSKFYRIFICADPITEIKGATVLCYFAIQTHRKFRSNRLDRVIMDDKRKICFLNDMSVWTDV